MINEDFDELFQRIISNMAEKDLPPDDDDDDDYFGRRKLRSRNPRFNEKQAPNTPTIGDNRNGRKN